MNVSNILDKVGRLKPNALTEDDLIDLINEVEVEIAENVLHLETYALATKEDKGAELLAPKPYEQIYFNYITAKIDYFNGETDFYALTSQQFNNMMKELVAYCIRKGLTPGFTGKRTNYF